MLLESDLLEKQIRVEEYIDGIDKSELRMMFRLYYLDHLTYAKGSNADESDPSQAQNQVHGRERKEENAKIFEKV